MVKVREDRSVRTRACYLAIGVTVDGEREVLGLWWQEAEGAKFWLAVLNDLHHRGVEDVLVCCVDGLTGFPEAIEAVYPQAWVQTCIVHQIRNSVRYVAWQDRKRVVADLKPIYRAVNADAAELALAEFDETWAGKYPMIADSWRSRWEYIVPFLSLPADLRRAVYTTDESVKEESSCRGGSSGVRLVCGRGRPPSEAQVLGLMPAAQLAPQRAFLVASHWRRPRPAWACSVALLASRRRAGGMRARPAGRARARVVGLV
jgi:hypothetical protein